MSGSYGGEVVILLESEDGCHDEIAGGGLFQEVEGFGGDDGVHIGASLVSDHSRCSLLRIDGIEVERQGVFLIAGNYWVAVFPLRRHRT